MPSLRFIPIFATCATLLFSASAAGADAPACLSIDEPYVTVEMLASAVAPFRTLPADLRFGLAPDPGLRRIISPVELNRFLREVRAKNAAGDKAGPETVEQSVCLIRNARRITPQETTEAMRRTFAGRTVEIEILELSKRLVGEGSLNFSLQQLPRSSDAELAVTWNGWMIEKDGRRRPTWARVRLSEKVQRLVATKDLRAGEILNLDNTAYEERSIFPGLPSTEPVLHGKAARKPIAAGEAILPSQVVPVPLIQKGDELTLEVVSNQTRLAVDARAESTAYAGERMSVSTPLFKRTVQAVAKEKGRAVLETAPARRPSK